MVSLIKLADWLLAPPHGHLAKRPLVLGSCQEQKEGLFAPPSFCFCIGTPESRDVTCLRRCRAFFLDMAHSLFPLLSPEVKRAGEVPQE